MSTDSKPEISELTTQARDIRNQKAIVSDVTVGKETVGPEVAPNVENAKKDKSVSK